MQPVATRAAITVFLGSKRIGLPVEHHAGRHVVPPRLDECQVSGGRSPFALIASTTNGGFSYAGVNLSVGTDVQILTIGALTAPAVVVPVTLPFPARDRYYVQAVFTDNGFASISASNFVVLINYQAASLFMPIGGSSEHGHAPLRQPRRDGDAHGVGAYRSAIPACFRSRGRFPRSRQSSAIPHRRPADDLQYHHGHLQLRRDVLLHDRPAPLSRAP